MTRILLLVVVVLALAAVLWSSWRLDRRLFLAVAAASLVTLALFVAGFFNSQDEVFTAVSPQEVRLEVISANPTEYGVRLRGRIHNDGAVALGRISAQAILLDCSLAEATGDAEQCREQTRVPLELRQHVPAQTSYPFDSMLRLQAEDIPDQPRWRLEVSRVQGYTAKKRLGH